uniref:Uncharacterized protein n=1 Tax=Anguilla anguilla TaxID=7936 RepID=A0A0E9PH14_ANGAN
MQSMHFNLQNTVSINILNNSSINEFHSHITFFFFLIQERK